MKPGDPTAVEQLFDAVAPRYDRLNDVLSFGLHRQWKRQVVRALRPVAGEHWLDLCCGTGDLALELARCVRPGGRVIGVDAAAAPLHLAEARQQRQPWLPVRFQQGDALETGLLSGSADGLVMAYGLRNLSDPARGLEEMRRVLKRGGRAAVLDFNRLLPGTAAAQFQRLYLRRLVVPIAASVGLKDEYAYLEESLQRFPMGHEQEDLARRAGFSEVQHQPMVGGQMGCLMLRA